jgi:hypothetical protein
MALRLREGHPCRSVLKAIHLHLSGVPDVAPAGFRPISCKGRDEGVLSISKDVTQLSDTLDISDSHPAHFCSVWRRIVVVIKVLLSALKKSWAGTELWYNIHISPRPTPTAPPEIPRPWSFPHRAPLRLECWGIYWLMLPYYVPGFPPRAEARVDRSTIRRSA